MRKAQTAAGASALIALIAAFIILYIVIIPPEERASILRGDPSVQPGQEYLPQNVLLLERNIGLIREPRRTHHLRDMLLQDVSEPEELVVIPAFELKKTVFSNVVKTVSFPVKNPELIDNLLLSFQTPERNGVLKIVLNGFELFSGKAASPSSSIQIKTELLSEINTLEFSVSGSLFERKRFIFSDAKLIGDRKDVQRQSSLQSLQLSSGEISSIESSFIDFFPVCDQSSAGKLKISVNNKAIFFESPICESINSQEVFKSDLIAGDNEFEFVLQDGSARIEQVALRTIVSPTRSFLKYFDVSPQVSSAVARGQRSVVLSIAFSGSERSRRATVNINGELDSVTQRDTVFIRDISSIIRPGSNYLEIIPDTNLDIQTLEIRVE